LHHNENRIIDDLFEVLSSNQEVPPICPQCGAATNPIAIEFFTLDGRSINTTLRVCRRCSDEKPRKKSQTSN
jgi:ribosomal protein L40E